MGSDPQRSSNWGPARYRTERSANIEHGLAASGSGPTRLNARLVPGGSVARFDAIQISPDSTHGRGHRALLELPIPLTPEWGHDQAPVRPGYSQRAACYVRQLPRSRRTRSPASPARNSCEPSLVTNRIDHPSSSGASNHCLYLNDTHLTTAGHRLAASVLAGALRPWLP